MSEKTVSDRVANQPASRPGIISFVVVGVIVAAFGFFIFFN